jgi:hypothetical protein
MSVRRFVVCMTAVGALVALLLVPAWAGAKGNPNPGVTPINASIGGMSYGDLGDAWWRWLVSIPGSALFGPGDLGPTYGPVLLLGASYYTMGSVVPVERWVTISSGQKLFLPVSMGASWVRDTCLDADGKCQQGWSVGDEELEETLRANVRTCITDTTVELHATVDGQPLRDLFRYFSESSRPFSCSYAPESLPSLPESEGELPVVVTEGWSLVLNPLSPGQHVVTFGARAVNPSDSSVWCAAESIYHITVVPAGAK